MLNCRMFRLLMLFVDLLICVLWGLLLIVVLSGVPVCGVWV